MRYLLIACLVAVAAVAAAKADDELDLDTDCAVERLARAAGACAKTQPAFIQQACGTEVPAPRAFTIQYGSIAATSPVEGVVAFRVPVREHGKGFLFAITEPAIHCDDKTCIFEPTAQVFVKTAVRVDPAAVAQARFVFRVDGMWRVRQWWSPRTVAITATLLDARGKVLGAGTVLTRTS